MAIPSRTEGRIMIVATWDGDAMDAEGGRVTSAPDAYGKDVWSRRRDTGVKFQRG